MAFFPSARVGSLRKLLRFMIYFTLSQSQAWFNTSRNTTDSCRWITGMNGSAEDNCLAFSVFTHTQSDDALSPSSFCHLHGYCSSMIEFWKKHIAVWNWDWCEINVVAVFDGCLVFVMRVIWVQFWVLEISIVFLLLDALLECRFVCFYCYPKRFVKELILNIVWTN